MLSFYMAYIKLFNMFALIGVCVWVGVTEFVCKNPTVLFLSDN